MLNKIIKIILEDILNTKLAINLIIIFCIGLILILVSSFYSELQDNNITTNLSQQIVELDNIQKSLTNLQSFITNQKNTLLDTQKTIDQLNNKKQMLEPIVKANKEHIEALFRVQEERNQQNILIERIVSFLLGVISSLVATLITNKCFKVVKRKKELVAGNNK